VMSRVVVFSLACLWLAAHPVYSQEAGGECVDVDGCPVACWREEEAELQNKAAAEIKRNFQDNEPPSHSETSCISDYSKIGLDLSLSMFSIPSLGDLLSEAQSVACEATDNYLRSLVRRADLAIELPLGVGLDADLYEGDNRVITVKDDIFDGVVGDLVDGVFDDVIDDIDDGVGPVIDGPPKCIDLDLWDDTECVGDVLDIFK